MPNERPLNQIKYGISTNRFWELRSFCLQYNEWKDMLKYNVDTVKSPTITDMPTGKGRTSDPTATRGVDRALLSQKCDIIEQTARETDEVLYPYIIKAVTNKGIGYNYLSAVMNIPCSHNTWYKVRRQFYILLNKKVW